MSCGVTKKSMLSLLEAEKSTGWTWSSLSQVNLSLLPSTACELHRLAQHHHILQCLLQHLCQQHGRSSTFCLEAACKFCLDLQQAHHHLTKNWHNSYIPATSVSACCLMTLGKARLHKQDAGRRTPAVLGRMHPRLVVLDNGDTPHVGCPPPQVADTILVMSKVPCRQARCPFAVEAGNAA